MIKRKVVLTLISSLSFLCVLAQQDAQFSQYFFNPLYVNPAYAGSRDAWSGVFVYRSQWVDLAGQPTTQAFSLHGPFKNKPVGLGIQLYNDQAGPLHNIGLIGTYAYWIPIGNNKLSFGLQGSISQLRVDWSAIRIEDETDESFTNNTSSSITPDANFGMYFHNPRYYLGLSATHLIENKFHFGQSMKGEEVIRNYRHYYILGGVVIPISEQVNFRPSFLAKYILNLPFQAEANASFIFLEKICVGVGYRTSQQYQGAQNNNQLIGILEYTINNKVRIGYSYDAVLNELSKINGGTHEIMIGYDFNLYKDKMLSPRFF